MKTDLKMHLVRIPKYRKALLTAEEAVRGARPEGAHCRRTGTGEGEQITDDNQISMVVVLLCMLADFVFLKRQQESGLKGF